MQQDQHQFRFKNKIQRQFFYHQHLPSRLSNNYFEDRQYFLNQIIKIIKIKDIVNEVGVLGTNIKVLLTKFRSVFGMTPDEYTFFISLLFDLSFTRIDIRTESRIKILLLLNEFIMLARPLKTIVLDWKVIYSFLKTYYLTNQSRAISSEANMVQQLNEITTLLKQAKLHFVDESVKEVYNIFKQMLTPSQSGTGYAILILFLKFNSKTQENKQLYQVMLDEIIEYQSYQFIDRDSTIFFLIKELLKYNKDLNWEKHLNKIMYLIIKHINNMLRSDNTHDSREERLLDTLLPDPTTNIKCPLKMIPEILVYLLPPSTNKNYELIWSQIERMFSLIDCIMVPQSQGDWTIDIFKFFKQFTKKFIKRYKKDSEKLEKLLMKKANGDDDGLYNDILHSQDNDQGDLDIYIFDNEYETKKCNEDTSNVSLKLEEKKSSNKSEKGLDDENIKGSAKKVKTCDSNGKENSATDYLLDYKNKERFINNISKFFRKFIFMEDSGYALAKLFLHLCYFDPENVVPNILKHISAALQHQEEMIFTTIKNILIFIVPPILCRGLYKSGIFQIFDIITQTFNFFKSQGVQENLDVVEIYSKIFLYIPINDSQELIRNYLTEFPGKTEEDFKQELNAGEPQDLEVILHQITKWAIDFFTLIVDNLQNLEIGQNEQAVLLFDFQNINWQFFFQASQSIRLKWLDILFEKFQLQSLPQSQTMIGYLLDCFSLLEPEALLQKTISLVSNKILKKRTSNSKQLPEYKNNSLYFLIEYSEMKDTIFEQEISIDNPEVLLFYLSLIENSITYANIHIQKHKIALEQILYLCLFEEEPSIYDKTLDIIHTIILSLSNIYPKSIYYLNKKYVNQPEYKYFYLKYIKKLTLNEFQTDWFEPGVEERKAIQAWMNQFLFSVLDYFDRQYFNKPEFHIYDYSLSYRELISKLLFHKAPDNQQIADKKEIYRLTYLVMATFSGFNIRVPFFQKPSDKMQTEDNLGQQEQTVFDEFQQRYMFSEYTGLREKLLTFCLKLPTLLFDKQIVHDKLVLQVYHYLCRETFGESFLENETNKALEQIEGLKQLNQPTRYYQFDNMHYLTMEAMTYLYEKIDFYHIMYPLLPDYSQLFYAFFILSFSRQYNFKFFFRFVHDQQLPISDIFHKLHFQLIQYMKEQIDPINYPDTCILLKIKNASESERAELEKIIEHYIDNLKRIVKMQSYPCCSSNPDLMKEIFPLVSAYDVIELKKHKKVFIDCLFKTLSVNYEDCHLINALGIQYFQDQQQITNSFNQQIVLSSNSMYNDFKKEYNFNQYKAITYQQALQTKEIYLDLIQQITNKLLDTHIHWKAKTIYCIMAMQFFNIVTDYNNSCILQLLNNFFELSKCDNLHLNQLGRACLLHMMNIYKRQKVKITQNQQNIQDQTSSEQMKNEQESEMRPLDDFLKYHFIKKQDLKTKILKNKDIGYLQDYPELLDKTNYEIETNCKFGQLILEKFSDSQFCKQFIGTILLDKDLSQQESDEQETEQIQQSIDITQANNILQQLQLLFGFLFDKDRKKNCPFVSQYNYFLTDFYFRFFKKTFQLCGDKFFQATKDYINSLMDDIDSKEKQRVISIYVCALVKWLQKIKVEDRQQYMQYAIQISSTAIINCSLEMFREWLFAFVNVCKNNDFRISEEFISALLVKTKNIKTIGKRFRYYDILKYFLNANTYKAREFGLEALQTLMQEEITEKRQCDEISDVVTHILACVICIPINLQKINNENWIEGGVQKYIDSKQIFVQNQYTAFEDNQNVRQFFNYLTNKIRDKNQDENQFKLYSYITFRLMCNLIVHNYNDLFWSYFRDMLDFLLENKVEDINENDVLVKVAEGNLIPSIKQEVIIMLTNKIASQNWNTRLKAIIFMRGFLENKVDVPEMFIKVFQDENHTVSMTALNAFSDILKIATQNELQLIYKQYSNEAELLLPKFRSSDDYQKIKKRKIIGIYVLMALVLAWSYKVFEWTEPALEIIFKNQNLTQNLKKTIREFISNYSKTKQENDISFNEINISNGMKQQIKEIANPYSYFA